MKPMHLKSRFFGTRNSSGAVLAVGETRPATDFYVSADLTRTSERRLQSVMIELMNTYSSFSVYMVTLDLNSSDME